MTDARRTLIVRNAAEGIGPSLVAEAGRRGYQLGYTSGSEVSQLAGLGAVRLPDPFAETKDGIDNFARLRGALRDQFPSGVGRLLVVANRREWVSVSVEAGSRYVPPWRPGPLHVLGNLGNFVSDLITLPLEDAIAGAPLYRAIPGHSVPVYRDESVLVEERRMGSHGHQEASQLLAALRPDLMAGGGLFVDVCSYKEWEPTPFACLGCREFLGRDAPSPALAAQYPSAFARRLTFVPGAVAEVVHEDAFLLLARVVQAAASDDSLRSGLAGLAGFDPQSVLQAADKTVVRAVAVAALTSLGVVVPAAVSAQVLLDHFDGKETVQKVEPTPQGSLLKVYSASLPAESSTLIRLLAQPTA